MQPTHTIWTHRIRQKFEKEPPPHPTVLTPHTNRRHFVIIIAIKCDPTQLMYERSTTLQIASPRKNAKYHELSLLTSMQYNNNEI